MARPKRSRTASIFWTSSTGGTGPAAALCEDTVESLDYGAHNKLIDGITGGQKKHKKKSAWTDESLKWCHQDDVLAPTLGNHKMLCRYIARNHREIARSHKKRSRREMRHNGKYFD